VRVLAYFPNVVLISAFLGLGIGTMRAGKALRLWLWPASLALVTTATLVMHQIAFTSQNISEFLWLLYLDIPNAPVVEDVRIPIVVTFVLTALSFVVLGQIVGERLQDFNRMGIPLAGYIADLAGSLIGVIGFALASFCGTFPVTWFGIILVLGAILAASRSKTALLVHAIAAIAILSAIGITERTLIYSPYYAIRTRSLGPGRGTDILVNGSFHQYAAPIRRDDPGTNDYDIMVRQIYPIPYRFLPSHPRSVLVLGAGTGNDVAVALDQGAEHIDAVEIDPAIISLGKALHPDHPYSSPRANVFNTDARSFLRNTTGHYDLIVFGTLDSQTRLSALSNVRLDNFVYTIDCMRMARQRLAPDGGMALYFFIKNDRIRDKISAMLTSTFGQPPIVFTGFHALFSDVFLAGPAWGRVTAPRALVRQSVDIPTDDWPYLYLDSRKISAFYVSVSLIFLGIAAVMIALLAPEMRSAPLKHFDAEMFLFGAAFLLLETKLVTQMNLLWGSTWITSAVVFASILLTILIGTILMQFWTMPFRLAGAGLVIALLGTYAVPTAWLLARTPAVRLGLSILFAGGPIFFASICFALLFRERQDTNLAFGWNLAGAVIGGLVELVAIVVGLRSLALIALAAYLASFVAKYVRDDRHPQLR